MESIISLKDIIFAFRQREQLRVYNLCPFYAFYSACQLSNDLTDRVFDAVMYDELVFTQDILWYDEHFKKGSRMLESVEESECF